MTPPSPQLTELLVAWSEGEQTALDQLLLLVTAERRRLAAHYMRRESPGHTLQTSALVNEAYLRLIDQRRVGWQNRAHFFGKSHQGFEAIFWARRRQRMEAWLCTPPLRLID